MKPSRIITVDLEDWFHPSTVHKQINRTDWDRLPSHLKTNTDWLLDLLLEADTKGTFFVLGCIAEKYPTLISRIAADGHEVACHGYYHTPLSQISPRQFRHDIERSIDAIGLACGERVRGFRAPDFSLRPSTFWALDILAVLGFEYDSSMASIIWHPNYGYRGFPRTPFQLGGLLEMPVPSAAGFPVGGGYFRLFPYWVTVWQLQSQLYSVFYIHPWELSEHAVPASLSLSSRFRHSVGRLSTRKKISALVRDFSFETMGAFLQSSRLGPQPPAFRAGTFRH